MHQVQVCFDKDCYEVAAKAHPFDADRIDETGTVDAARLARRLDKPLAKPLDEESVKVSIQRVVPDAVELVSRSAANENRV